MGLSPKQTAARKDGLVVGALRLQAVMAGLVPAIHAFGYSRSKAWMPATSAGMTNE
jgi:hypothetical protein